MDEGTVDRAGAGVVFRYERRLAHPVDRVWAAITDPAEIERWTGSRPEIDLRPGGRYVTYHGDGTRVVDRVLRVEPPTVFEHTFWAELNPDARVAWRLDATDEGCRLRLTHRMSDADIANAMATVAAGAHPVLIMSRNGAGWHRLLDVLGQFLDGRTAAWTPDDQENLRLRYEARLPARPDGG